MLQQTGRDGKEKRMERERGKEKRRGEGEV